MNMNRTTSTASISPQLQAEKLRKRGVIGSVLAGALLIVLGLVAAFSPLTAGVSLAYLLTGGLGLYGGMQTFAFFRTPREQRSSLMLANGLLLIFFSLFTLYSALQSIYGTLVMITLLSSVIAFFTILGAVARFSVYMDSRDQQLPGSGFMLASSILNVILGSFLLINPIVSWFSLSIAWGIYLSVSGLSLMIESFSSARRVSS